MLLRHKFALALLTIGLVAQPLGASATECAPLTLVASLDLTTLPGGRTAISAKIVGKPITMLVDTGSAVSAVTPQTVRDLKLGQLQNGTGMFTSDQLQNGGGISPFNSSSKLAQLPLIEIGPLTQKNALYYVLPSNDNISIGNEVNGLIGGEWLKNFDADFDFAGHKLNLFSSDHCVGKVIYWRPDAVAVLPFRLDNNHIRFPVELDGEKVDAILDTGAFDTSFNLHEAETLFHLDPNASDTEKVGEIKGPYTANLYRHRFKTLTFEGMTISNPGVQLIPDFLTPQGRWGPWQVAEISLERRFRGVALGMSMLSKLHVYIAYKEHKIYITAAQPANSVAAPAP